MKTKVIPIGIALTTCLVCARILAVAEDDTPIDFSSVKGAEQATARLREEGIRAFMDEIWRQGVAAPGIHSKYWLDQFTRGKPKLHAIEKAYRDFGHEIAVQAEDLASQIYEKPDKKLEMERLDWLLRFSEWMLKPGRFENYRIGMRVEDAATMPLLRILFDLDVPVESVESQIARFTTVPEGARIRARILYEESNGVFDVRDLAENAREGVDDGFEGRWIKSLRAASRHYGNLVLHYSTDPEILRDDPIAYSFFMDDNGELGGRDCMAVRWDDKCHKAVCVLRGQASHLVQLKEIMLFRKEVGAFPDVTVPPGADARDVYADYYTRKFNKEPRVTSAYAAGVASYYLKFKNNTYKDRATDCAYRTKGQAVIPWEKYERRSTTRERRALNQQWLKKNRNPQGSQD